MCINSNRTLKQKVLFAKTFAFQVFRIKSDYFNIRSIYRSINLSKVVINYHDLDAIQPHRTSGLPNTDNIK